MRNLFLFSLTALGVAALIFVSCLRDPDVERADIKDSRSHGRLTKEEAQSEFERHFAAQVKTRSGSDSEGDLLVDFDYTPLWYDGKLEHNDYSSLMTVPILTDRIMFVGYYGDGGGKPTRVARVTQELHIVKNFEIGITLPTIKTVIPLNGVSFRKGMRALEIDDYYRTRSEIIFYQTPDGRKITAQMFVEGVETVHAFIGEEPESYHDKMSQVYAKLRGYGVMIEKNRMTRGNGESDNNGGGPGGGGGWPPETQCFTCQGIFNYWEFDDHQRICKTCDARYQCGDPHTCPSWCNVCQRYSGCTPGMHGYVEDVVVEGKPILEFCENCVDYFPSSHSCPTTLCNICQNWYTGRVHNCPGQYCAACVNAPCLKICSCGVSHCTVHNGNGGNNGGGPSEPKPEPEPDEDWRLYTEDPTIDQLMVDLKKTVSGQKLYDILISLLTACEKGVVIQYQNPPPVGFENYEGVLGQMDIPGLFGLVMFSQKIDTFFEELTHVMQSINSPHELDGVVLNGNKELEVKMMRYEFAQGDGITLIGESNYETLYKYANGDATFADAIQAMESLGYASSDFVFNEDAFHMNNRTMINN